jgi:ADP-ribose pyrophosphatase YjhB (NUDIX family)
MSALLLAGEVTMFNYCLSRSSRNIRFENNKKLFCPGGGIMYYHNTAAATGYVISIGKGILFLVRGKEPVGGKLDFPGGFVDPGEGVSEGLCREYREELDWDPASVSGTGFSLFASFPNTCFYKGIVYSTCDMFFTLKAPGLCEKELYHEEAEIVGVRFIRSEDIGYDDLAFDSTSRAVRAYVERLHGHD